MGYTIVCTLEVIGSLVQLKLIKMVSVNPMDLINISVTLKYIVVLHSKRPRQRQRGGRATFNNKMGFVNLIKVMFVGEQHESPACLTH